MNKKMTPQKKADFHLLYKYGLPLSVLASVLGVRRQTLYIRHMPSVEEKEQEYLKESLPETRLFLLKLYAWLLADQKGCAEEIGPPLIIEAKVPLFNYLKLKEWEQVLEGFILYKNLSEMNRYTEDVPTSYQKLIEAAFPSPVIKKKGSILVEEVLIDMHSGKIDFPTAVDLQQPTVALEPFIRKHIQTEPMTRLFSKTIVPFINDCIDRFSLKKRMVIKSSFGICTDIEYLLELKDLRPEQIHNIKNRCVQNLGLMLREVLNHSISARLYILDKYTRMIQELETKKNELEKTNKLLFHCHEEKISLIQSIRSGIPNVTMKRALHKEVSDPLWEVLKTDINDLDLSVRAFNSLTTNGIKLLAQLVQCNEARLLKIRNFGVISLAEVKEKLEQRNLHLEMVVPIQ